MYVIHKYIHVNKYAPINASIYTNYINIYIYIISLHVSNLKHPVRRVSECVCVCVCVSDKKNPVSCAKVCPNGIESIDHESCVDVFEIRIGPNAFFQVA